MEKSPHISEMGLRQLRARSASLSKEIFELEHRLITNAAHDEMGGNTPEDNAPEAQSDLVTAAHLGERIRHLRDELTRVEERIGALQEAA